MQAGHRLPERLQRARHVAARPRGEAEEPGGTAAREMVVGPGEVQRAPGVFRRTGHITPCLCERGPVDGDDRRQRAEIIGVGPRWRRSFGYGGEGAFCVVESGLDGVEVAGDHEQVSGEDTEHRAAPDGVLGQRRQPAEQHGILPVTSDLRHRQLDEVGRPVEVPRSQCMPDRLLGQVVRLVPAAGPLVQLRSQVGLLGEQARPQHLGEQMVVAIPLPLVVQGDEEEVRPLQGHEHVAPVVAAGHGITQRPGEPVEDRRAQQKLAHGLRLVLQHLLDEVVDDVPVVPGEAGDEAAGVVAPLDGQSGELQRRNPPLGALLQGLDVARREAQSRCFVEVRGGLVGRESQVGGTDLDQVAAHSPSSQLQVGVSAGAEHHMDVGRQVVEEEGHPVADFGPVDQVVVVEDQPHLARCGGQVVEQ